jgi:hypothetical protein
MTAYSRIGCAYGLRVQAVPSKCNRLPAAPTAQMSSDAVPAMSTMPIVFRSGEAVQVVPSKCSAVG